MSVTFTKLFSSITASTVWCESSDTRVVWITMLAMSDRHGRVWASIPGLAKEAAVSVDACRTAITLFLSPDPDSRTKVAEGRRIEEIDGGWRLINHAKYRAIRDEEERRAYKTEKEREYRAARVDNVDKCGQPCIGVDTSAHNAEAEAEADTEAGNTKTKTKTSRKKRLKPQDVEIEIPAVVPVDTWKAWVENRALLKKPATPHAQEIALRQLVQFHADGYDVKAILETAIVNNWQGLFVNEKTAKRKKEYVVVSGAEFWADVPGVETI